jgi:CheY-like chemotaxis protein
MPGVRSLAGSRILVVEDECVIVMDMIETFQAKGAEVIGPAASVAAALELAATQKIDGAVLDLNLRGEMAYPVADLLQARGVPFIFATGYGDDAIPKRYAKVRRCQKPVDPVKIAEVLFR